jgi:hypothetical protein
MKKIITILLFLTICATTSASIPSTARSTARKAGPLINNATGAYSSSKPAISMHTQEYPMYNRNQQFQPMSQQYAAPKNFLANQESSISDSFSKYLQETKTYVKEIVNETEDFIQNEIGIDIGYKTAEEQAFAAQAAERIDLFNHILKDAGINMPYETFITEAAEHTQTPNQTLKWLKYRLKIYFVLINTKATPLGLTQPATVNDSKKFEKLISAVQQLEQNIPNQTETAIENDSVILHNLSHCLNAIVTINEHDENNSMSFTIPAYPTDSKIKILPSSTVYNL